MELPLRLEGTKKQYIFFAKTLLTPFLSGEKIASIKDAKSTADEGYDACEVKSGNKCSSTKKIVNL